MVHQILTRERLRQAVVGLRALGDGLLHLALPPFCLSCGNNVPDASTLLCFACIRSADRADADDVRERLDRLPAARKAIDMAYALWIFDKGGFLQHVHQALKYGNRPHYGLYLGRILGCAYERTLVRHPPPDVLVPIPLHRSRLYERGYNQSDYLARGVAAVLDRPIDADRLQRPRPTRSQTRLSRSARWENLRDAFVVTDAAAVTDRRVLLVDDILTTGATVGAAAHALLEAGAAAVDVVALGLART
ncbi:MAG: phosphoribosyltransferase family protein [Rhodothermales bacterium]